jgi:hypothetical protein
VDPQQRHLGMMTKERRRFLEIPNCGNYRPQNKVLHFNEIMIKSTNIAV